MNALMVLYISNASQLGKPSLQQTAGSPYGPCRKSRNSSARCRACGTPARPPAMLLQGQSLSEPQNMSNNAARNVGVGVNSDRRKPSTPMTSHSGRIVAPHQLTRRASHLTRQSIGPAGCWAASGATSTRGCGWNRASTSTWSIGLRPPAMMSTFCPNTTPIRWAGAVVLHPDGTCEGVHDPRANGGAAGV